MRTLFFAVLALLVSFSAQTGTLAPASDWSYEYDADDVIVCAEGDEGCFDPYVWVEAK